MVFKRLSDSNSNREKNEDIDIFFYMKREISFVLRVFSSMLPLRFTARSLRLETFDIFDTCLSRKYSFPEDLFIDLARELIKCQPEKLKNYTINSLSLARMYAQKRAYASGPRKDPTLSSIYSELGKIVPELNLRLAAEIEKKLEAKSLVPCAFSLALVEAARKKYGYVVFISDMYMPKDFLYEQLFTHGFLKDGDKVYVSCEQQGNKSSGLLFREVAKAERIRLAEILHSGDNRESDVMQPLFTGMQSREILNARLSIYEQIMYEKISVLSSYAASRFVGAVRSTRISRISERVLIDDLVASFAAPFLWAFGEWILDNCKQHNIDNIYLSSRDCLGLFWVLSKLIEVKGIAIKLSYFQASRSSLLKASLYKDDQINLCYLRKYFNGKSLASVLAFLEVDIAAYRDSAENLGVRFSAIDDIIISERDWNDFERCLRFCSAYQDLLARAKREKDAAINYFSTTGLSDCSDKFVVDLIVSLNCSEMLQCLVDDIQGCGNIVSLFLAVGDSARLSSANVKFKSVFDGNFDFAGRSRIFFDKVSLFELLLSCDASMPLGSYLGMSRRTCTLSDSLRSHELNFRKDCGAALSRYATKYVAPLYEGGDSLRMLMLALAEDFILSPQKRWLDLTDNLNEVDETFSVSRVTVSSPLFVTIKKLSTLFSRAECYRDPSSFFGSRHWRELALVNTPLILYLLSFPAYAIAMLFNWLLSARRSMQSYPLRVFSDLNRPVSYTVFIKLKRFIKRLFGFFARDSRAIVKGRYLK